MNSPSAQWVRVEICRLPSPGKWFFDLNPDCNLTRCVHPKREVGQPGSAETGESAEVGTDSGHWLCGGQGPWLMTSHIPVHGGVGAPGSLRLML